MIVKQLRLDDKCQLCRQHKADHVWRRDHVMWFCGRCFYWLVSAQGIVTHSDHFGPNDITKIVVDYRGILAGGGSGSRFFQTTADLQGVDVGTIRNLIRGYTFKEYHNSMAAAGIPGPGYWPEQIADDKREAILGGGLAQARRAVTYSRSAEA